MISSGAARTSTGTYVRLSEIASGGMGSVELAMRREGTFRRLFAIKRLLPSFREDSDVRAMFIDEARIAGLLRHPNAVSVVDVGEDHAGPFLVMEYVEGLALSSVLTRMREPGLPVDVQLAARIVAQCAHGLHAAHELRGHDGSPLHLVHRDVSPHNILVGFDGIVRVTDFGIAKAAGRATRTSTGLLKGKLSYMAPEQLRFEEPDRRSDLFALGVVLHEMLSGTRLFKAKSPRDAARQILNEDAPDVRTLRPDVPDELASLVAEMLARDPVARPADASVVARRLEEIVAALAQREGSRDVAAFMSEQFQQAREESSRRIAETIASAESQRDLRIGEASDEYELDVSIEPAAAPPPSPARSAPLRWAMAGAALVALLALGGALAWASVRSSGTEPSEPPSRAPAPERAELPPAPEPATAEASDGEPERAEPTDRAPGATEVPDGAEPASRPAARRPRNSADSPRRHPRRWSWEE